MFFAITHHVCLFVCLILYVPVNTFQSCWDESSWVEPALRLAQRHKAASPVRHHACTVHTVYLIERGHQESDCTWMIHSHCLPF